MKLVYKKDLEIMGERMVHKDTKEAVSLPTLARQYDEVLEMMELNEFIMENKAAIEASRSEAIVYTRKIAEAPRITPVDDVPTPLRDAAVDEAAALAEEWVASREVESVNLHLERYDALAEFFARDYVEIEDDGNRASTFKGNIFELTEQDVIDAVIYFHDKETGRLRKMLDIRFI